MIQIKPVGPPKTPEEGERFLAGGFWPLGISGKRAGWTGWFRAAVPGPPRADSREGALETRTEFKPGDTLREVLVRYPRSWRIFEDWDVDYYCNGGSTLGEGLRGTRHSIAELEEAIRTLRSGLPAREDEPEWYAEPLFKLTRHIIDTHHHYLRSNLPKISELARKVAAAHRESHPETAAVWGLLNRLQGIVGPHLDQEEEKLFPLVAELERMAERGKKADPEAARSFGKSMPLFLEAHRENSGILLEIRKITGGFTLPRGACNSFQKLWDKLRDLERDTHHHLHLENNFLLFRAEKFRETAAIS